MGVIAAWDLAREIRESGRSWWQARYRDGRVVSEWATTSEPQTAFPFQGGESSRWEELDRKGLIGLRLLCPDGSIGELAAAREGSLFQFKIGGITVGGPSPHQWCSAHVIGAVLDADGRSVCRAWETGLGRLVEFEDNVYDMRYFHIGPLALENLGLRV